MKNFKFSSLLLVPLFAVLAACGGGGGGSSTTTPSGTPTLKSIAVTVSSSTIPIGSSQDLKATGTYSDGSTKVLASNTGLIWATKSGGSSVAQVFSSGKVTGMAVGTETINATQEGVTGSITLTITSPWTQVSAGGYQTIARKADGNLYAWGQNNWGQLGDSSTTARNAPVLVNAGAGTTGWKMVSVGEQFAVGIRVAASGSSGTNTGGSLWAWGNNQNGQLGDGTQTNRSVPVQIGKDVDWLYVSAGKNHVLAIKTNGLLYAWGRNAEGQLGDGTTIGKLVPTKIGTATWLTVSAGGIHSLGVQKDGSLYTWGGNSDGQLGNASTGGNVAAPVKIGTNSYISVSAGAAHSMAISADHKLWGWGANGYGQVGTSAGVTPSSSVSAPSQITNDSNWAVVAAGSTHTMGVRTDSTLWGWGSNAEGQLGDGNGDALAPVQIGTATDWATVSAGIGHSFGLKTDNTLWGWGRNQEGQLGNGKTVLSPLPVNVPN